MKSKTIYLQILIRLAWLVFPLLGIFLLKELTYNPVRTLPNGELVYAGSIMGYAIFGGITISIWFLIMLGEIISRFYKKDVQAPKFLLFFIIIVIIATVGLYVLKN